MSSPARAVGESRGSRQDLLHPVPGRGRARKALRRRRPGARLRDAERRGAHLGARDPRDRGREPRRRPLPADLYQRPRRAPARGPRSRNRHRAARRRGAARGSRAPARRAARRHPGEGRARDRSPRRRPGPRRRALGGRHPARLRAARTPRFAGSAAPARFTTGSSAPRSCESSIARSTWRAGSGRTTSPTPSRACGPTGIDVCSRLRPNGHLDEDLLAPLHGRGAERVTAGPPTPPREIPARSAI